MKNVRFDNTGSSPVFRYTNELGDEEVMEYKPPIDNLDVKSISKSDYCVELLINPLLCKESNVYMLIDPENKVARKIGVIMPVSVLSSDEQPEQDIKDCIYVAFHILLERLQKVKSNVFADNFEDNICVFVVCLKFLPYKNPLHLCIHSLRKYGYSYFETGNIVKAPMGYLPNEYIKPIQKVSHQ